MKVTTLLFLIFSMAVPIILEAQYAQLKHIAKPEIEFGVLIEEAGIFNSKTTIRYSEFENSKEIISR